MKPGVLIIDDEKTIRDYLLKICIEGSYQTQVCSNTEEAKKLLETEKFAVLIVDIFLPNQSGLDFIKEIQDEGNSTPVIAITGSRELQHAQQALRLNVFDYFLKPFEGKYLLQSIKNAETQYLLNEERVLLEKQKNEYQLKLELEVRNKVEELELSEKKYRQLIEQSILGVAIIVDGCIEFSNDKFAHIFGYEQKLELSNKIFINLALIHKQKAIQTLMQGCLSNKRDYSTIQFPAHKKNEDFVYIQAWLSGLQYDSKSALLVVVADITEQHLSTQREKKYALELLKENRMASIGQLAAGIIHNLNTPISIIQGNAELMNVKDPDNLELKLILKQTSLMNELIYTIATKGKNELNSTPRKIDLNELLTIEVEFLEANLFFKHYINCELNLDNNLLPIFGIYSDFSQSISAIIQNSIDSMYKLDRRDLLIQTKITDGFVELIIKDSGIGIDPEKLDKIFEPFFTTKPAPDEKLEDDKIPRGNGLGLSMAASIFKRGNILVDVNSELGKGTEFRIKIPLNDFNKE